MRDAGAWCPTLIRPVGGAQRRMRVGQRAVNDQYRYWSDLNGPVGDTPM